MMLSIRVRVRVRYVLGLGVVVTGGHEKFRVRVQTTDIISKHALRSFHP